MTRRRRTSLLAVSGIAALGVAGCGATTGTSQQVAAAGSGAQGTPPARSAQGPGGPSASELSAIAKQLGVSAAQLQAAMQATRPTSGQPPTGDPDAALAKQLGLSAAKVHAALQALRPSGGAPPSQGTGTGTAPSSSKAPSNQTAQAPLTSGTS